MSKYRIIQPALSTVWSSESKSPWRRRDWGWKMKEKVTEEHGRQGWHLTMPCQWVGASIAKAFKVLE